VIHLQAHVRRWLVIVAEGRAMREAAAVAAEAAAMRVGRRIRMQFALMVQYGRRSSDVFVTTWLLLLF
jgi:hypothetical protein